MVDLDGTLFDTKEVNYRAYQEAVKLYGFNIEYEYYCKHCNGRHYLDFLPQITTEDKDVLSEIHKRKKEIYASKLEYARLNNTLVDVLKCCKSESKVALVTTASKQNTEDILNKFKIYNLFDLIITQDDIKKMKPDPESYLMAMKYFGVEAKECVIFEDSSVGIEAAERSGATVFVVKGYN